MDLHRLHRDGCEAVIAAEGAELQALRLGGRDLLWDAGPLWPRHSPLLFPIVGGLKDGVYRRGDETFALPRHGFARDRTFTWAERSDTRCQLVLQDDDLTRKVYPFPFHLTLSYALEATGLHLGLELRNPGPAPLPASLGLHPAFRWPLDGTTPKAAHRLMFEADEPGPLRRLEGQGLLTSVRHPTPIQDRVLPLTERLFEDDALLFLEPRSHGLRFEAAGGPALGFHWEGFSHLGIWTKPDPGPGFLCIEPWSGHADPADWKGEFIDKPGGFVLAPGASRQWSFEVGLIPET